MPDAPMTAAQKKSLAHKIDTAIEAANYVDIVFNEQQTLLEAGWLDAKDLLDIEADAGFDQPPVWATDALKSHAADIGQYVADADKKALHDALQTAFETGLSTTDTAELLKQTFSTVTNYDEDGNPTRSVNSDAYFDMIARTELQRAANLGQYALYEAAGVEKVRWQAAEPCDECEEADDKVVKLGDDFPGVDVDCPPAHPNCRCVLVPEDDDLKTVEYDDADRAAARRGNQPDDDGDDA